jgi:NTP pyrophosphatase (non-canonical NTP hydrolase)
LASDVVQLVHSQTQEKWVNLSKLLMMTGRGRQKDKTKDQITEDFHKEMADVFCHVLLLARHHKINLEKEVEEKWLVWNKE